MSNQTKRDIRNAFLESRPDVRKLWDAHARRRELALAFVHMRTRARLSQAQVAEQAGWNKSYVSRLESIDDGSIPDTDTIARYARACEMEVGLVFAEPKGKHQVVDVVPLQGGREGDGVLKTLRDEALAAYSTTREFDKR